MNKILELRVRLGLTQKELAKKLNIVPYTLARWEHNKNRPTLISAKMLIKIAAARKIKMKLEDIYNVKIVI